MQINYEYTDDAGHSFQASIAQGTLTDALDVFRRFDGAVYASMYLVVDEYSMISWVQYGPEMFEIDWESHADCSRRFAHVPNQVAERCLRRAFAGDGVFDGLEPRFLWPDARTWDPIFDMSYWHRRSRRWPHLDAIVVAMRTFELRPRVTLERQVVEETPSAIAYVMLASTERDLGHLQRARAAFLNAIELLEPKKQTALLRLTESLLGEVTEALRGNGDMVQRRIALRRVATFPKNRGVLVRQLRLARQNRKRELEVIYLDGLAAIARSSGDEPRRLRYLCESAAAQNTSQALQLAALELEGAGDLRGALRLVRRAVMRARRISPELVCQLEAKEGALRRRIRESRRTLRR